MYLGLCQTYMIELSYKNNQTIFLKKTPAKMFDSLEYAYGNGCWNNIYGGVWSSVYRIGQTWEKLVIIELREEIWWCIYWILSVTLFQHTWLHEIKAMKNERYFVYFSVNLFWVWSCIALKNFNLCTVPKESREDADLI